MASSEEVLLREKYDLIWPTTLSPERRQKSHLPQQRMHRWSDRTHRLSIHHFALSRRSFGRRQDFAYNGDDVVHFVYRDRFEVQRWGVTITGWQSDIRELRAGRLPRQIPNHPSFASNLTKFRFAR